MSLRAYQQAAQRAESPRDIEYRLFGEVTRALIDAAAADPKDLSTRAKALDWNRRLWSALALDCANSSNGLPPELRASIVSLNLWVMRHSSAVMRGAEAFDPLIDVNRSIMQGLRPMTEAA
jgi:flagellar biosynthesis activator protein FlaF